MTTRPLTLRQSEILAFLKSWLVSYGFPPTRSEIAQHFGFRSDNGVECHLKAIAKKGHIELIRGTQRGIQILDTAPVVGTSTGESQGTAP